MREKTRPGTGLGVQGGSPKGGTLLGQSEIARVHFQEAGMETAVRGMPLPCPPKPERLNAYGNRRRGCSGVDQRVGGMGPGE